MCVLACRLYLQRLTEHKHQILLYLHAQTTERQLGVTATSGSHSQRQH